MRKLFKGGNYIRKYGTYARKLYDPKMKRIFEITQANFEKIQFIHINKHMDGESSGSVHVLIYVDKSGAISKILFNLGLYIS